MTWPGVQVMVFAANAYFGMTGVGIEFLYNTHNAAYTGAYSINDESTGELHL